MANQDTFFQRLKKAPKSLAVLGLVVTGSSGWWWPIFESALNGHFGPDVQKWATLTLAVFGVIGWAIPQPSISGASRRPEP